MTGYLHGFALWSSLNVLVEYLPSKEQEHVWVSFSKLAKSQTIEGLENLWCSHFV